MKKSLLSGLIAISSVFTFSASAQLNRSNQASNIVSTIYENGTHAITGTALQQVMLNQNNSYVNLISDTNLLDIRNFSPYAVYTPGMGCFHNDTLYRNIAATHGSWSSMQWKAITGTSLGCFISCSDTGKSVVTYYALDSAYNSHCFIACADTGKSVLTYHALDSAFNSHCFITCSDTGGEDIPAKIATTYAVLLDVSEATGPLVPFADTSSLITTHYESSLAAESFVKYSDTASGGGTTSGPKIATHHELSAVAASRIPFSDTNSVIATQHQLTASSGAIHLLSQSTINLDTTADQTITLTGGTTFVITDIVLTNVSAALVHATDGEWWSGTSRSGKLLAFTAGNPILLTASNAVADVSSGIIGISQPTFTSGSLLYFSLGTAEGTTATCNMLIYGYILN